MYVATTQNNVYKINGKTGEIVSSRNLGVPFMATELGGEFGTGESCVVFTHQLPQPVTISIPLLVFLVLVSLILRLVSGT